MEDREIVGAIRNISHGGICRIIRTYFIDMSNDEFFSYTLENGKLEEYEL